eukprot:tig00020553_g10612.t1
MLDQLSAGAEAAGPVLVLDDQRDGIDSADGEAVFSFLVRRLLNASKSTDCFVLVALERPPAAYYRLLEQVRRRQIRVAVVDAYTDPLGWAGDAPPAPPPAGLPVDHVAASCFRSLNDLPALQRAISDAAASTAPPPGAPRLGVGVAIDSLSRLLLRSTAPTLVRFLASLFYPRSEGGAGACIALAGLHRDLHAAAASAALEHSAAGLALVAPNPGGAPGSFLCHWLQKRRSGRVARGTEICTHEPSGGLSCTRHDPEPKSAARASGANVRPAAGPAAISIALPFSTTVTEQQRAARDRVVARGLTGGTAADATPPLFSGALDEEGGEGEEGVDPDEDLDV